MANLQEVTDCLIKTTAGTTEAIKKAEESLDRFSRDPKFIEMLLSIPQIQDVSCKAK